ncbi:MAG: PHD zinc finger-containing [Trebouxia sp. A1-2]|nr:MAG: PHD zinc finger-containing [Trebouxia sp. A1-2]
MDRAFQPSRKYPRRPGKSGLVDGFAEENAIFGGYNQSAASASAELASGNLRLLDNFTLYVQTDDEGSEELVDLQDLHTDGVHGLPLKATGTVLDHRLCSQQSVYDARSSSKIKVRVHYIRDWVVDYSTPVTVWLITDWAWYRLLSPSRIYKQQYQSVINKTKLVAACLQVVSSNASLSYDAVVRHLADGVAVLPQGADPEAPEYVSDFDGHDTAEVQRFGQHDLLDHAAFVVQQVGPVLGRHALKSFLVTLADRAGLQLTDFVGTGRKLTTPSDQSLAADIRRRPAPQTSFLVPREAVPSLLLVWDFCQRYAALLRLPPFPFLRLQLACLDKPPPLESDLSLTPSPTQHTRQPERSPTSCKECDASFSSTKALREHCSLSGHDPTRASKSSKQKLSLVSVQPAVPLELSVEPIPDQVEMERWGATGQGRLLCDIHSALIRVLEGLDEDLMEAPTMAGYGSAVDLAPQDAFRPLLGASWPELARRYLQDHGPLTVSQDAVEAVLRLKVTEYNQLSVHDRALILEGLVTIVANTELLRNHLRHLEPEGATPVLNRGAVMGQDSAGNIYHQLGGPSARGSLYVEAAEGQAWGWYSPHQIPSLIAWLETGSQQEQQLAEELYTMYQPVLRLVAQPGQASGSGLPPLQELWQPSAPSKHHLTVSPEALQQPRDGYKGSQPVIHPSKPLQHELLRLLATAPFWNKDLEWLQSRAAVQSLLPRTTTGPEFARLLWLIEELLYEDLLKGSGWGRRRGWFREQLEATRNVAQAAALGGQLAAHCRREGDLGLVTPQELLQSAQRQRCYLGYIPQPPQDVVLFKSGYEAHVRQQERSVPAIPAWLESWAPMQDCKVKQMACVVEHLPASQRQASLRSQSQPGFPPRVIEPPCTAWLLLEKEPSIPQQGSSDEVDEEIDWTHFTFQHGFRQLLHHLQHHLGPPSLAAPPTQDVEMSEASPSPSPSSFATLPIKTHQESGLTPESEDNPPAGFAGQATDNASFKQEAAQQAQHADLASTRLAHAGHGHELKEEEEEHMAGAIGAGVDEEREGNEGRDSDDESAEGQRLTRSRRGNAAGLYMLDHGSQLVPKKIRQARPVQRPARLLNNALEDGSSMNLNEAERAPALPAAPAMLPGEDRIRFWRKERSLLAVALHVKPGMTRAAEFLVPVQLCNRALSVAWPLGMPVKMPFTGTVLDHLTKPRPDTHAVGGGPSEAVSAAIPAEDAGKTAHSAAAATQRYNASQEATQMYEPAANASSSLTQADKEQQQQQQHHHQATVPPSQAVSQATPLSNPAAASAAAIKQDPSSATATTTAALIKSEPATSSLPPTSSAATTVKSEPSMEAAKQDSLNQGSAAAAAAPAGTHSTSITSKNVQAGADAGVAASTTTSSAAANGDAGSTPGAVSSRGAVVGAAAGPILGLAGVGLGAGAAVHEADPWNALDVLWDSDTPPGWPKMVCPWQVMEDRGGELRKAKERYRQAEAEKREKARQENLVREANRRATAERQQQAAAALQAERMRRALEARAVVAQVAEQKEADRAALAAVQGGAGQSVTGPQLLASVVPRSTAAGAVSSVGLPSAPAASAAAAGLSASSAFSQQMMQQLQGGAAAHQLPPQAQYPTQPAAGSQSHALHPASHAMAAAPLAQHHSSYQYPQAYTHPQMGSSSGTHAGQMGAMDSVQDTAVLQVQAALTDPSKASINMPAQQISAALQQGSRPQVEASQGVGSAGAIASTGAGLQGVAPAAALSGQQHAAGVLSAAGGNASGEAGTPGSSPAETENSALGKRGRSADADEQSSPPRAKKAKPAELLVCKGPCLRAFHPACLGMTPQAVINPASQAAWFCPECLHGRVRCFVCGEFGAGFEDPTVRKCSLGVCGRFYHIKCAQALELTQMAKKGAHFRCPQHYCAVCRKSGDGVDMVKCIRCPTAYHSSCMPKDIQRLLPHAKVVLCSNHVDQPLAPYQHPPAPDPNKLEAAQQQGKAMGLPPVKAKSGHASGSGTGFSSPDQRQSGSQQADVPQESVSGQGAGLTNPAAAGEAVPVGAATIQSSQYTDNTQGEQQAFLQAGPSAPGSLPPLQQLQTQPGLPSAAAIPAVSQLTTHVPHSVSQQQQQQQALTAGTGQPGQPNTSATPFAGASLQGIPAGSLLGVGPGPPTAQAGLTPAQVHGLAHHQLLRHTSQSLGVGGMQPMGSGHLSYQSSEPLSHQSSGPLSHHGSGQLAMQLQQQLPHAVSGQMLNQAQIGRESSGQLSQHASGQLLQFPSGQLPVRQGSVPRGADLITQGLRGSQIALELEAADRAKQQAASAAAAGMTCAAPVVSQGAGLTVHGSGASHRAALPNLATASGLLQQRAGLPDQAMTSGMQPLKAGMPGMQPNTALPSHALATVQQLAPASSVGQMHTAQMYGAHGQGLQSAHGMLLPDTGMLNTQQQQQQQQQIANGNQTHADSVRVNTDRLDGIVSPLGSPTIGLKLGQIHSPGLSEDALGGDQEFMDAMQAMSDDARMK